ncbi:MAG: histidine--tRNA ligase [Peptococcaceae bacterium]|nr:histidine--tRNA ligase [Peptococcaceae bacterium]
MLTSKPRGTNDIIPGETELWQKIEAIITSLARNYGYREIRTPIFEHTELFLRGVGENTDIVDKEMYTFEDKGGRSLTLRPEGTAAVARAYLENKMYAWPQPVKMYYLGPMFRHDRPQAGRYRQFHQFGVEIFGTSHPASDAEVIHLCMAFYQLIGLENLELHINSVGCPQCREILRQKLMAYFESHRNDLCSICRQRVERNPLRILDCKNKICRDAGKDAPTPLDCLCQECRDHFASVRRYLDVQQIAYIVNPRLVRGLDYYTKTAFEVIAPDIGAQSAIGGGGRYDGLVETCGGPHIPGVGFAIGLERTISVIRKQGLEQETHRLMAFVAMAGDTEDVATRIIYTLRQAGVSCDRDYIGRSLKAQMKYASKINAKYVVIVGEDELARGNVTLRDMDTGKQYEVELDKLVAEIKSNTC